MSLSFSYITTVYSNDDDVDLCRFKHAKEAIEFAVVLLVASIPLALEIVVTTTLALGSRQLAADGAIVTRLAAIEDLSGMNILCSDKTGTLTLNKMEIQKDTPTYLPDLTQEKVLVLAALAAKWREPPRDALDTLVLTTANLNECDKYQQLDFTPFDPTTKYTGATVKGPDGTTFKVVKGAPHVILGMCKCVLVSVFAHTCILFEMLPLHSCIVSGSHCSIQRAKYDCSRIAWLKQCVCWWKTHLFWLFLSACEQS
jgi:magnesium-transporting ATPase (P-type)